MLDAKKENIKIHVEHLKKNFGSLEVLKDISTDILLLKTLFIC